MFELPKLPYSYDALEPFIDARTMELHHSKHHATYVAKLNEAIKAVPELEGRSLDDLLKNFAAVPESVRMAVRNHGGGHYNHSLFWETMQPPGGGEPQGKLAEAVATTFGDFGKFREAFTRAALGVFGSGWAWLTIDDAGLLAVSITPNQDSPISQGLTPLLGLDVWEHAYYLKYQNRRPEYVENWWNVVNWAAVAERLD